MFKKQAVSTRKHFQWQNYKLTIIITIVILCILAAIIGALCGVLSKLDTCSCLR